MSGNPAATLGDLIGANAQRFPDTVAYRVVDQSITHAELACRATRLASAMARSGVRRQDRVVLFGQNSVEFCEVLAAGHLSGIIIATPNWRWSLAEVRAAIDLVGPVMVFYDPEYAGLIASAVEDLQLPGGTVCFGTDYEEFLNTGGDELPFAARADDIALLLFTSGTTGGAKCCIEGQREFLGILHTMNNTMRTCSTDRVLINMPMCHIGAMAIAGGVHVGGGTVVLQRQFDVREALDIAEQQQITVLHLAPVMLQRLLGEAGAQDALATVRTVVYSAAPITVPLLRRALEMLPQARFVNMYGQTEGIVSGLPAELHTTDSARELGSVGFPFPDVRVRVVDGEGRDVKVEVPGEIVMQSGTMFRGYWNDHCATLDAVRDGWYHTGDIGCFDTRGLLHLIDRKKDVIITGGENVYSPEVENALSGIAGVAECAVVGVPDERFGEVVCAAVVPTAETSLTLESIVQELADGMARYKIPRRLVIVDALPRLGSGKIDKKRLRADLAAGSLG
ncbi:AMP-binding protein [Mycobacterium sp. NBC_00419]|uniref:class I adenylate-forming enzyme family protein n=1 Tax=Mycobacterium sp. NBC_00419 TaxID=2975989 RepID=UPI002E20A865